MLLWQRLSLTDFSLPLPRLCFRSQEREGFRGGLECLHAVSTSERQPFSRKKWQAGQPQAARPPTGFSCSGKPGWMVSLQTQLPGFQGESNNIPSLIDQVVVCECTCIPSTKIFIPTTCQVVSGEREQVQMPDYGQPLRGGDIWAETEMDTQLWANLGEQSSRQRTRPTERCVVMSLTISKKGRKPRRSFPVVNSTVGLQDQKL